MSHRYNDEDFFESLKICYIDDLNVLKFFVKCTTGTSYESYLGAPLQNDLSYHLSPSVIIVEMACLSITSCYILNNHVYDSVVSSSNKA